MILFRIVSIKSINFLMMKFVLMHLCMVGVYLSIGCNSKPQSDIIQTDSLNYVVDTIQGISRIKIGIPEMKYSIFS